MTGTQVVRFFLLMSSLAFLAGLHGQAANGTQATTFEVSVIKPSPPPKGDTVNRMIKPLPGGNGYIAQNFPVRLMIALMYEVPVRQVEGGPGWLDSEYYDIEAHADGPHSKEELHAMFRALLADRFALRMHPVTREGKVFALRLAAGGPKMQPNPAGPGMNIPITYTGLSAFAGQGVSMAYLCWFLGQQVQDKERPVIDQTGLTGTYDFKLTFLPEQFGAGDPDQVPADVRDKPPLATALKEQLGLQLTPETGPVTFYTIEHIERPSAN